MLQQKRKREQAIEFSFEACLTMPGCCLSKRESFEEDELWKRQRDGGSPNCAEPGTSLRACGHFVLRVSDTYMIVCACMLQSTVEGRWSYRPVLGKKPGLIAGTSSTCCPKAMAVSCWFEWNGRSQSQGTRFESSVAKANTRCFPFAGRRQANGHLPDQ